MADEAKLADEFAAMLPENGRSPEAHCRDIGAWAYRYAPEIEAALRRAPADEGVVELVEQATGALQWLEQLADRFEDEWPNTAKHCRLHVNALRTALSTPPAEQPADDAMLREALKPFADKADKREAYMRKRHPNWREPDSAQITHRLGDFRRARAALNPERKEKN